MEVSQAVHDLITLAIQNGRFKNEDRVYAENNLLRMIGANTYHEKVMTGETNPQIILDTLLEAAQVNHMLNERVNADMLGALIMDMITPLPSQINQHFWALYATGPRMATDYFYELAQQNDTIKTRAIAKNVRYFAPSKYGELEITINLSKPEKDPKAIAQAAKLPVTSYPEGMLSIENEGYFGRLNYPGRSNHRIVKLTLAGEPWGLQYSPYAYFNEHAIVLSEVTRPMVISRDTFVRLADFIEQFPHYMIGSNADLPIVGGSILTHDHYQAGRHEFPMARAQLRSKFTLHQFPNVQAGIVKWPMSVIRLDSLDKDALIDAGELVRTKWNEFNNEALQIKAVGTDGIRHHTVTPIMRKIGDLFELDLVLRDNNVSAEFPDGIFHPHPDVQHIKQENIGLIEVMGLAILPPRLLKELAEVKKYLLGEPAEVKAIHQPWAETLKQQGEYRHEDVDQYLQQAVANVFERVLEDAGVFKDTPEGQAGFAEFIATLNE
ncbi:MAG: UDP-glucose--hexose-1-phosphate uridylyltransferase [Lactobacillaceae bacterium]|nr:UDP-glucose--hexose-1-phosphate uridylyltransferase [Lactobacillaceae bacterium]